MKRTILALVALTLTITAFGLIKSGVSNDAAAALATPLAPCVPPPPGLVAWYPGDGNAYDIKGGNNGTLQGGATFATGVVGQAFSLNGTNAFVQAPTTAATDLTLAGSQDAWVYFNQLPSSAGHIMEIIGKGSSGNDFDLQADGDNKFHFYISGGFWSGGHAESTTIIQTGVWYHVAGTWSNQTGIKIYVNGVLEGTSSSNLTRGMSEQPLMIGNQPFFGPRLFNGLIDEVEVFNRALDQSEVQAIYNAGGAGKCKAMAHFKDPNYSVNEDCTSLTITVERTGGDASGPASVDYSSINGTATNRGDYIIAQGRLQFAAGETSKSFDVLINEDSYAEGNETFSLNLSNPSGVSLGAPSTTTVTITDDASEPYGNVIYDPRNYVCQHYHDFLNRQPDPSGWDFWTNQITSCGSDAQCTEVKRINVSASFFLSIEFQQTGYLVERMYKAAYGDAIGGSTWNGTDPLPVPVVRFDNFMLDTQQITKGVIVLQPGWEQQLEINKQAFANDFVRRPQFYYMLPTSMTPAQFVNQLDQNAGNPLSASEKATAINLFGGATNISDASVCAQVIRQVAEHQNLSKSEFNRAFVLMQYVGYLRRNPNDPQDSDYTGYDFWLTKLDQFNGNYINAEMVKAFISSFEYQQRFGP